MKKTFKIVLLTLAVLFSLCILFLAGIFLIGRLTPWSADKNRFQSGESEDIFHLGINTLSDRYTPLYSLSKGTQNPITDSDKQKSTVTLFADKVTFRYQNSCYIESIDRYSDRYQSNDGQICVFDAETGDLLTYDYGHSSKENTKGKKALSAEEMKTVAEDFARDLLGDRFAGYEAVTVDIKNSDSFGPYVLFAKSYFGYRSGDIVRVCLTPQGDVWYFQGRYINDNMEYEDRLTEAMLDKAAEKLSRKLNSLGLNACEPGTSSIVRDVKGNYYLSLNFTYVGLDGESYYDCLYYRLFRV